MSYSTYKKKSRLSWQIIAFKLYVKRNENATSKMGFLEWGVKYRALNFGRFALTSF